MGCLVTRLPEVFISVAEDSADLHAAALVRAARERGRDWALHGLTGPRLRALGVETVFDFTSHAAMLGGVFRVAGKAWAALHAAQDSWRRRRPDLVVLLDSPALHLPLARRAKALGLKVLYYIAPQTWASREGRVRQIRAWVDRLACILPFEEAHFRAHGIAAEYVGHPLFESLAGERPDPARVARLRGAVDGSSWLPASDKVIALLPGSRRHVIDAVLPLQLDTLRRLPDELRSAGLPTAVRGVVSCAAEDRREQILRHLVRRGMPLEVVVGDNASLLTAADLVLVASGTATLHVARYRKPMVVLYDAGRWLQRPYELAGRLVVRTPHLSLLNVLAGARVVPEFMPFIDDVQPVARVAAQLLADDRWRELMVRQIDAVVRPLEGGSPSRRGCELMTELLEAERSCPR